MKIFGIKVANGEALVDTKKYISLNKINFLIDYDAREDLMLIGAYDEERE